MVGRVALIQNKHCFWMYAEKGSVFLGEINSEVDGEFHVTEYWLLLTLAYGEQSP